MRSGVTIVLGMSLLVPAAAVGIQDGKPSPGAEEETLGSLIKQLSDASFARREAASERLAGRGETALPAIREAAASTGDPEVRARAERIVLAIMTGAGTSKSTGLKLTLIHAGWFTMGGDRLGRPSKTAQTHGVGITRPFLMGVFEVTQDQYRRVMEAEPSGFSKAGNRRDRVEGSETGRFPVEGVSWFDAVEFCNRLSALDGYPPYYTLTGPRRETGSITAASVTIAGGGGYRLPTEAQWEYACRAGTQGPYHFGAENSGRDANFKAFSFYAATARFASMNRTEMVGSYPANAWGLHDMHGNVGEWCWDWFDMDYYARSPANDPPGPDRGDHRVVRGGSWLHDERNCYSFSRLWLTPDTRKDFAGFRVSRMP